MPKPIKNKILVVNPFPIYPPISGAQRRTFNLFKYIACYYDVVVVCFSDRRGYKEVSPGFRQILVPKSPIHIQKEIKIFYDLKISSCAIMPLISRLTPEYAQVLQEQANNADIILLSHPYLFDEVQNLKHHAFLVYDAHNVEFELHSQILSSDRASLLNEIYRVEKSACEHSSLITTCSDQDANSLASLYNINPDKFLVVPNGTDTDTVPFTTRSDCIKNKEILNITEPWILFMGSYHIPNLEAAKQVIEVAQQLPDMKFLLLGSQCQAFKKDQLPCNVKLLGIVSEHEKNHIFTLVDIALNPMLSGSGTNIKMFDYMVAGIPVITTPFGARGINGINKKHFIICEPQDFPARILDLLSDRATAEYLAVQAFSLVKTNFDWKKTADNMIYKLNDLLLSIH